MTPTALRRSPFLRAAAALAFALVAACSSVPPAPSSRDDGATLAIVHLNDLYEIQPIEHGRYGGPARVATVIAELRRGASPVLVTLAGDYLSPSALGTARVDGQPLAGRQMVDVLDAMGLDWATFGNHEFDVSEAAFRAHLKQAKFRIVSTNVTDARGQPFDGVPTSAVVPVALGARTVRIGLIGVTIDSTDKPWVKYRDPIVAAREEIAKLAGRTDAIVALTHLRLDQDADFAAALPQVDLILGGHEHENWLMRRGPRLTPIVKADANVRSVAIVSMRFPSTGARPEVTVRLREIDDTLASAPAVDEVARRWTKIGMDAFRRDGFEPEAIVAVTGEPLDGRETTVRNRPGRLTDLIADGMRREAGNADVAIFNGGAIRIDDVLAAGPVTEYDVIRVLPFGGRVMRATFDGALLARVLDTGVHNQGLGGYLQTAGVRHERGGWTIGGRPIDPAGRYSVAIADFLLTGGEVNLGFLTTSNPQVRDVREGRDIRRVLIESLRAAYPQAARR